MKPSSLSSFRPAGLLAGLLAGALLASAQPQPPQNLRCEYLTNPEAVDAAPPRLSWQPVSALRGDAQTAYQILVSKETAAAAGDVWDSGQTKSAQFVNVPFAGKTLESGKTYFWKVRSWDKAGTASPWSSIARFGTGLLNKSDWKGKWIAGGNALRKEFNVTGKVTGAKIFIAAAGYYELHVNGARIGNHVLDRAPALPDCVGRMRAATPEDFELVLGWEDAFVRECGLPYDCAAIVATVRERLHGPAPLEWLWEVDGTPVAKTMARPMETLARIAQVYTPPEQRGHGYAGALVGSVCAALRERGCRLVFLSTDMANPTSNGVYRRIGFRFVGQAVHLDLAPASRIIG